MEKLDPPSKKRYYQNQRASLSLLPEFPIFLMIPTWKRKSLFVSFIAMFAIANVSWVEAGVLTGAPTNQFSTQLDTEAVDPSPTTILRHSDGIALVLVELPSHPTNPPAGVLSYQVPPSNPEVISVLALFESVYRQEVVMQLLKIPIDAAVSADIG